MYWEKELRQRAEGMARKRVVRLTNSSRSQGRMRDGASSAACIDTSIQVSVPSAESALEASAAGSLQPEQDAGHGRAPGSC